jgi:transcriptional repressor NrdR
MLVEDTLDALEARFESEIPSSAIGEGVMQRLRRVDEVAYVRFASIYKQFRDVTEFVDEISALGKPKIDKPE